MFIKGELAVTALIIIASIILAPSVAAYMALRALVNLITASR
jgi:hypothetical protein